MSIQKEGDDLQVQREMWENIRYRFNEEEQRIEEGQIRYLYTVPHQVGLGYYCT